MRYMRFLILTVFVATVGAAFAHGQGRISEAAKPRVVITADPELDDNDTLIRAVLYTTDFDLEGLVYVSSGVHWKGDGKGTTQYRAGREYTRLGLCKSGCTSWRWPDKDKEKFIDDIVDAYAKSYANLKVHDRDYPDPAKVKSKIKWGNVDFDGDYSKDTDGSNLIKGLLLDNQPGPLFVTAQGGQSTIARALKSIYDQYHASGQWNAICDKVSHKLIIIPWGDQDGTYASYIKPNWPDVANWQLAMVEYGYGIRNGLAPEDQVYISGPWTRENVLDRGPLGALYRVWGDGKRMVAGDPTDFFGLTGYSVDELRKMGYFPWTQPQEKDSFISEGDTPTYMNLLDNGLRADENGYWGGWGGIRRENAQMRGVDSAKTNGPDDPGVAPGLAPAGTKNPDAPGNATADVSGASRPNRTAGQGTVAGGPGARRTVSPQTAAVNARFFAAAQNDFAARLKWSVTPNYKDANHPPVVSVKGPLNVFAAVGSTVKLQGQVSDPDHNEVKVMWWQYNDASTYPGDIHIPDAGALSTTFQVPTDAKPGQTIHVILEATDNGTPALTRYQRVVVTVR